MNNLIDTVDDFRFIGGLHTTARLLPICSGILRLIGTKQIPVELLKRLAIEWSTELERRDPHYSVRKGKLTDTKNNIARATSAFEHYFQLLQSYRLINRTGNIVSTTRTGSLLNLFSGEDSNTLHLNPKEKVFYVLYILNIDADALILSLSIIADYPEGVSQKKVLSLFKEFLLDRITGKRDYANTQATEKIREWYLKITRDWVKPEVYAEHLLVPRFEWMSDLGFVTISKQGSHTNYKLTTQGHEFYFALPIIEKYNLRDINESWYRGEIVTATSKLLSLSDNLSFHDLPEIEKNSKLGEQVEIAFRLIDTSGALRVSLFPAFLYIAINLLIDKKIVIEFSTFVDFLKTPLSYNSKKYGVKESGRVTESYLTIIF
jgi:hypothetical protein